MAFESVKLPNLALQTDDHLLSRLETSVGRR